MITNNTLLTLVDTFNLQWERLKNPIDSNEKKRLIKLFAQSVKNLNKAFSKSNYSHKFLFEYLLNTVWGAPFVFEMSLKQASQNSNDFKALVNHMLEHSHVIDRELSVAKEQIVLLFCKKKSA